MDGVTSSVQTGTVVAQDDGLLQQRIGQQRIPSMGCGARVLAVERDDDVLEAVVDDQVAIVVDVAAVATVCSQPSASITSAVAFGSFQ